jgi:hypothetical protein
MNSGDTSMILNMPTNTSQKINIEHLSENLILGKKDNKLFENLEEIFHKLLLSHDDMSESYGVFFQDSATPQGTSYIEKLGYNINHFNIMNHFNILFGLILITVITLIIITIFKLLSFEAISMHQSLLGLKTYTINKEKKRNMTYTCYVHREPTSQLNFTLENLPTGNYILEFRWQDNGHLISRHHISTGVYFMRAKIEFLHYNLKLNIDKSNKFQDIGVRNSSNDSITQSYYNYNALVKRDLSILRKYETFISTQFSTYKRKPKYVGEE